VGDSLRDETLSDSDASPSISGCSLQSTFSLHACLVESLERAEGGAVFVAYFFTLLREETSRPLGLADAPTNNLALLKLLTHHSLSMDKTASRNTEKTIMSI